MSDAADKCKAADEIEFPPSTFTLVYQSKDGKLCLFEDAAGHITAVRAEKLA